MPRHSGRSSNSGNRGSVKRWQAMSKTGGKAQASQIWLLQKQTNKLLKRSEDRRKLIQFKHSFSQHIASPTGEITGPSYGHQALIAPNVWEKVFNTTDANMNQNQFNGHSIGLEYRFDVETDKNPVTYTIMVLRARKDTATEFAHDTGNGVTLTKDVHYTHSSLGTVQGSGMVMVNKSCFDILYVKKGMVGPTVDDTALATSTATTSIADNNVMGYVRIPWKRTLKTDGKASASENKYFKGMTVADVDPTDQIHLYCFANNYGTQICNFYGNMIISGHVTA